MSEPIEKEEAFEAWFRAAESRIRAGLDQGFLPPSLIEEINEAVRLLSPELRWEVGPLGTDLFFAFGISGKLPMLQLARQIVSRLHRIDGWTFLAGKPHKIAGRRIVVGSRQGRVTIDFERWGFTLVRRKGKVRVDLYPDDDFASPLSEAEKEGLAWMIVEFEIGEVKTLEHVEAVTVGLGHGRPMSSFRKELLGAGN